ncbi:hypothetical protein CR513_36562, partial [Mucuna pruriens]
MEPEVAVKIKEELEKQWKAGFLEMAKYPQWVANIVPVPKKDGKVRMCIDYRDLNRASPKDNFPLPHFDLLVNNTTQHSYYSFMDGFSRYNQIWMADRHIFIRLNEHQITKANYSIVNPRSILLKDTVCSNVFRVLTHLSNGRVALQVQSNVRTPILSPYKPREVLWRSPKVRPIPYRGIMQSLPHQLVGIKFGADFSLSAEDQIHQSVLGIPISPLWQTSASQSQTCISSIERNTKAAPCTTVNGEKRERGNGCNESVLRMNSKTPKKCTAPPIYTRAVTYYA